MSASKNISLRIPASVKWSEEDLIDKAEKHGMNKSEFMIMAIDTFMGLTPSGAKRIKEYADLFRVSTGVALENTTLNEIAKNDARKKVFGSSGKIRVEFASSDDGLFRGDELYKMLFDMYYREAKNELEAIENKKKIYKQKVDDWESRQATFADDESAT